MTIRKVWTLTKDAATVGALIAAAVGIFTSLRANASAEEIAKRANASNEKVVESNNQAAKERTEIQASNDLLVQTAKNIADQASQERASRTAVDVERLKSTTDRLVAANQNSNQRYVQDQIDKNAIEVHKLSSETDEKIATQKAQIESDSGRTTDRLGSAQIFANLLTQLRDPKQSRGALLVLWMTYKKAEDRRIIIPAALLASEEVTENINTIEMLGPEAESYVKYARSLRDPELQRLAKQFQSISSDLSYEESLIDKLGGKIEKFHGTLASAGAFIPTQVKPHFAGNDSVVRDGNLYVTEEFPSLWQDTDFRTRLLANWSNVALSFQSRSSTALNHLLWGVGDFAACAFVEYENVELIGPTWGTRQGTSLATIHRGIDPRHAMSRLLWELFEYHKSKVPEERKRRCGHILAASFSALYAQENSKAFSHSAVVTRLFANLKAEGELDLARFASAFERTHGFEVFFGELDRNTGR